MYKLFTDKTELFECNISLQGASLKKSKARLVVETPEYSLLFNGSISKGGKCEIPIKKLKGLIDENTSGNIRLEVIAEDTFFTPWESDFEIETAAVNIPASELKSPLVSIDDLKEYMPEDMKIIPMIADVQREINQARIGVELWRYLLYALIVLLVIEMILSNAKKQR